MSLYVYAPTVDLHIIVGHAIIHRDCLQKSLNSWLFHSYKYWRKKGVEQIMYQVKTFGKNEVIFKEGVYDQCMYEIQSGSVNIYVDFGKTSPRISLQTVIQGEGPVGGAPIRKYFYE